MPSSRLPFALKRARAKSLEEVPATTSLSSDWMARAETLKSTDALPPAPKAMSRLLIKTNDDGGSCHDDLAVRLLNGNGGGAPDEVFAKRLPAPKLVSTELPGLQHAMAISEETSEEALPRISCRDDLNSRMKGDGGSCITGRLCPGKSAGARVGVDVSPFGAISRYDTLSNYSAGL